MIRVILAHRVELLLVRRLVSTRGYRPVEVTRIDGDPLLLTGAEKMEYVMEDWLRSATAQSDWSDLLL